MNLADVATPRHPARRRMPPALRSVIDSPSWELEGLDWPNRETSRFVEAGGLRWHVQVAGPAGAPVVLLLHGTGAATHSWSRLLPLLAQRFRVLAPDLPGHGFTALPAETEASSLPGMARGTMALLQALGEAEPALLVGHSAGAAVALRMVLDRTLAPRGVVSLNGALLPLQGVPGQVFAPIARLLARVPLVPWLFTRRSADAQVVRRLLEGTGSHVDAEQVEWYGRLVRKPGHVTGALRMMANWDLAPIEAGIGSLACRLLLVVGEADRTIDPRHAERVRAMLPAAGLVRLPGLGHLAHEEAPELVLPLIQGAVQ